MAGRYGGGLACVISWPLLSAEKVSRPREESARHQLHKSDPFPPRNVDPSWEMAQLYVISRKNSAKRSQIFTTPSRSHMTTPC